VPAPSPPSSLGALDFDPLRGRALFFGGVNGPGTAGVSVDSVEVSLDYRR
jgi:hypothetical protein